MTRVDWIALAVAVLGALSGLRRGFVATAFSLAGLAAGAVLGARIAPHSLHGGSQSPYTSLAALAGAIVGAGVLQGVSGLAGSTVRGGLSLVPGLRSVDTVLGAAAGAVLGLALVWVTGAMLLQLPGQNEIRSEIQQSQILSRLNQIAPPSTVLRALNRVDPFQAIAGPPPPSTPPNRRALSSATVQRAHASVVRIVASACGLGIEGSGWVVRPHLVVTNAHVVAGGHDLRVNGYPAEALVVDRRNDIAILRVPSLPGRPLPLANPQPGASVAILGYPENGPFDARPGVIGSTSDVLVNGTLREITAIRGLVRHGNSGGPAVDADGRVQGTIFAARVGSQAGYSIPATPVRRDLAKAKHTVSTGRC